MQRIMKWWKSFVARNIIDWCPYPPECFDCDRSNCDGCRIM